MSYLFKSLFKHLWTTKAACCCAVAVLIAAKYKLHFIIEYFSYGVYCFAVVVRYLHLQSGEVAWWVVKVAGWEIGHSQFGYQPFLGAQHSSDRNVLKLQQVQSYLRDSTKETNAKGPEWHRAAHASGRDIHANNIAEIRLPHDQCRIYHPQKWGRYVERCWSQRSCRSLLGWTQRSRKKPHVNGTSDEIRATAFGKNKKPLKC